MFLKTFAIALPVLLGGMWIAGSFDPNAAREAVEYSDDEDAGLEDDRRACRRIQAKLMSAAIASGAIGGTMEDSRSAFALAAALQAHKSQWGKRDCDRFDKNDGRNPRMSYGTDYRDSSRNLDIRPGKPMLDARPPSERW